MTRALYTTLLRLLFPLVFAMLVVRGWRNPRAAVPWAERLAWRRPPPGAPGPLWIHAVSLGEVQAAAALVSRLQAGASPPAVLFTVGTLTGMERARAAFRDRLAAADGSLTLAFAPLDFPGAVRRFLDHFRPRALVLLEMELWPNLLAACDSRGIPAALVSARLSAPSVRRYRRFASRLMAQTLGRLAVIAAQGEADAARLVELGAPAARVAVGGNLKFDHAPAAEHAARAAALRAAMASSAGAARRIFVAGSTQEGEEAACLEAVRLLAAGGRVPPPLLVLAPRMPGRFEEVARWLSGRGVSFARRSAGAPPVTADCEVLLVDALGELVDFYALADVAFVGGTLVPLGGHNLLEPAALGVPVACGPYTFNAPQVASLLQEAGALRVVADAPSLAAALEAWLADGPARREAGEAGRRVVEANRGAVERTLALLAPVLGPAGVRATAASGSAAATARRPSASG